jgi:hypothetical protein
MNVYQEAVLKARKEFLKLSSNQEKELLRLYIELANQLKMDISKCKTSNQERYLKNLHEIVQANIRDLNKELNKIIKENIETSSEIASSVNLAYYEAITDDVKLSTMFKAITLNNSQRTVSKLIQGNFYQDKRSLDARLWKISDKSIKDIDTLIKVNVLKGANARELAKQVDKYVNPKKVLKHTIDVVDGKNIYQNVSWQSTRLARTSITHSFNENTLSQAYSNPFNKGMKWELSSEHSKRMHGKRDVCDDYAGQNSYDLGTGVFPLNKVPVAHPCCLCYQYEITTDIDQAIKEIKAWTKGESNPKLDKWYENYNSKVS